MRVQCVSGLLRGPWFRGRRGELWVGRAVTPRVAEGDLMGAPGAPHVAEGHAAPRRNHDDADQPHDGGAQGGSRSTQQEGARPPYYRRTRCGTRAAAQPAVLY